MNNKYFKFVNKVNYKILKSEKLLKNKVNATSKIDLILLELHKNLILYNVLKNLLEI